MKYTFAGLLMGVAVMITSATVYADKIPYEIEYDYLNGNVKVSVSAEETKTNLSLVILKKGKTEADCSIAQGAIKNFNDTFMYVGQTGTVSNGKYLFDVDYSGVETGNCVAYLNADGKEKTILENFVIVDPNDYRDAIGYVNTAATQDDNTFLTTLSTHKLALGFDSLLEGTVDMNTAMIRFKSYIAQNQLSETETKKNIKLYKTFVLMEAINTHKIETLDNYINDLYADELVISDYKAKAKSETISKYIISKISPQLTTLDSINSELKKALLFTHIKYADGYGEVVTALTNFGSVAGISGNINANACIGLVGKDYFDTQALLSDYTSLQVVPTTPGNNTSSGGTSRVPASSSGFVKPSQVSPVQSIKTVFSDIEGVDWAYEAIAALNDKNIISGRGENRFAPNDAITREEFSKIVVCALGLQNKPVSKNRFDDAEDGAWYVNYINIAVEHGICNGMGENIFGVGRNITRQDMTVMLYNALISQGKNLGRAELNFEDVGNISDYARNAIESMHAEGIINGISETQIDPLGTATRAQAAKMVWDMMNKLQ
ncbi:MAG: S-layer homology domain-containing protein [Clostridia bacterium]|nr:S-layer homology domain-containing protein [Clostridia bacterium]